MSVAYLNPSRLDNCEQYNRKALFGMRQAYGEDNVTLINATAGNIAGPINITVFVNNGSTNATGGMMAEQWGLHCQQPGFFDSCNQGDAGGPKVLWLLFMLMGNLAICTMQHALVNICDCQSSKLTVHGHFPVRRPAAQIAAGCCAVLLLLLHACSGQRHCHF